MTILHQDVHGLGRGPGPGGAPLTAAEATLVAAVVDHYENHRTAHPGAEPALRRRPTEVDDRPGGARVPEDELVTVAQLLRDQVIAVMTRAGYTREQVEAAARALPEQVDRRVGRAVLGKGSSSLRS